MLYCYKFTPPTSRHSEAPRVIFEYVVTFPKDARRDISGFAFERDGQGVILFATAIFKPETMKDPLTLSPIYSLSSMGAHIAAGSAWCSVMHLYDVRLPKTG
ncbi:hypothetical protein JB92DRAFT_711328 [Gautieria morchelliformis]|nr:hypothetical protein JB92DRAFT_711328 [Gautieria morchelliformis]